MHQAIHHRQYVHGLSLIELMVALAVSAIMLLGVTTVYTASKRSYQINNDMAAIQENARFALHNLTNEIRMAGYTGCMNIDNLELNVLSDPPPPGFASIDPNEKPGISTFNIDSYVTGHTDNGGNYSPAFEPGLSPVVLLDKPIVPGTDAITVRSVSACSSDVIRETDAGVGLEVKGNCDFQTGDVVIVTDCGAADMFTISDIKGTDDQPILMHDNTVNSQNGTTRPYGESSSIFKANATVFYIGQDTSNPPNLGLYSMRLVNFGNIYTGVSSLLIPNVENMAITYGLDTDGDAGRGVDQVGNNINIAAKDVAGINIDTALDAEYRREDRFPGTAWSRVVRVNLQLLLASDPEGTTNKPTFTFNGKTYDDTRSRRIFNTTVNIRSRTP